MGGPSPRPGSSQRLTKQKHPLLHVAPARCPCSQKSLSHVDQGGRVLPKHFLLEGPDRLPRCAPGQAAGGELCPPQGYPLPAAGSGSAGDRLLFPTFMAGITWTPVARLHASECSGGGSWWSCPVRSMQWSQPHPTYFGPGRAKLYPGVGLQFADSFTGWAQGQSPPPKPAGPGVQTLPSPVLNTARPRSTEPPTLHLPWVELRVVLGLQVPLAEGSGERCGLCSLWVIGGSLRIESLETLRKSKF